MLIVIYTRSSYARGWFCQGELIAICGERCKLQVGVYLFTVCQSRRRLHVCLIAKKKNKTDVKKLRWSCFPKLIWDVNFHRTPLENCNAKQNCIPSSLIYTNTRDKQSTSPFNPATIIYSKRWRSSTRAWLSVYIISVYIYTPCVTLSPVAAARRVYSAAYLRHVRGGTAGVPRRASRQRIVPAHGHSRV